MIRQPVRLNRQAAQRTFGLLFADAGGHADLGRQRVFNARQLFQAHIARHVLRRAPDVQRRIRRQRIDCIQQLLPRGDGHGLLRQLDGRQFIALRRFARHKALRLQRHILHRHQLGFHHDGIGDDGLVGDFQLVGNDDVSLRILQFDVQRGAIRHPALAQRGLIQPRHDARHAGHQRLRAGDGQRRGIGLIAVQIQPFRDRPGHFEHDGHAASDVALHVHGN